MEGKISFRLLLIGDRKLCLTKTLEETAAIAFASGVKAFQLREKDLSSSELLALAKRLRKSAGSHSAKLIINDRLDIAMLAEADGVHAPEEGVLPADVRRFSKNMSVGKSIHSLDSAVDAEQNGYDYIVAGPVFRTMSKKQYGKPLGLSSLKSICDSVRIPVYAVGGINPGRAKKCIKAGAQGVAVIGAVFKSRNIRKTVSEFEESLGGL